MVHKRMLQHVQDPDATPLLVFPEGTCVNNEYAVMFKRGAFDLGATVCPVAIKYNKIFVDAFWNSRRQAFTKYIVRTPQALAVIQALLQARARYMYVTRVDTCWHWRMPVTFRAKHRA